MAIFTPPSESESVAAQGRASDSSEMQNSSSIHPNEQMQTQFPTDTDTVNTIPRLLHIIPGSTHDDRKVQSKRGQMQAQHPPKHTVNTIPRLPSIIPGSTHDDRKEQRKRGQMQAPHPPKHTINTTPKLPHNSRQYTW